MVHGKVENKIMKATIDDIKQELWFRLRYLFIYIGRFVEGIADACIEQGKWNYIDKNGNVLFPQYKCSHSFGFENGWGEVVKDYKVRNYINKEGEFRFSEWVVKNS